MSLLSDNADPGSLAPIPAGFRGILRIPIFFVGFVTVTELGVCASDDTGKLPSCAVLRLTSL